MNYKIFESLTAEAYL